MMAWHAQSSDMITCMQMHPDTHTPRMYLCDFHAPAFLRINVTEARVSLFFTQASQHFVPFSSRLNPPLKSRVQSAEGCPFTCVFDYEHEHMQSMSVPL